MLDRPTIIWRIIITPQTQNKVRIQFQPMSQTRRLRGNRRRVLAYIGLGSNHGDRIGYIQQAVQFIKDIKQIEFVDCSSFYEAEPVGEEYSQWFVNAVAIIETTFSGEELLEVLQDIERRLEELHKKELAENDAKDSGRRRIIDLDILYFGTEILETSYLKVPHPLLHKRAFALVPLLELSPDLMHPILKKSVSQLHQELVEPEQVFLYGTRQAREPND